MGIIASNVYSLAIVKDGENGTSSYMFTRYSSIEAPHSDMYEVPNDDTLYIGTYVSSINVPSANSTDYNWVRYRSDDVLSLKIIADNGTNFSNDGKTVSLTAIAKQGKKNINGSYKWYKDDIIITNVTSSNYSFVCTGLNVYSVFKCDFTYNDETVSDSITIQNNVSILYGSDNPYLNDSTIYEGSIWIDTSSDTNIYYRYNGTKWVEINQQQYYDCVGYGQGKTTEFYTTKIKETADDITLIANRVSITETTINENYSEFKQTAQGITSEVSSIKSTFENQEIGGRNFVLKSNTEKTAQNTYLVYDLSDYGKEQVKGNTVVISFNAKSDTDNIPIDVYLRYIENNSGHNAGDPIVISGITTEYKRYYVIYQTLDVDNITQVAVRSSGSVSGGSKTATIYIKNIKVELGNSKPTDWTLAPEDMESSLNAASSKIEQNADRISWMVKSGTSSSNFTLTDRVATLIAEYINFNGLVTFSALSPEAVSSINGSIKVGSRNYIRNSKTMIYDNYGIPDETSDSVSYLVDENDDFLIDENSYFLVD